MHTPFLFHLSKKANKQIVCTSEVGMFFSMFRHAPPTALSKMQPGGNKDFGFCKITMTSSKTRSTCYGPQMSLLPGGAGAGFIISIPKHNFKIYHAGDTSLFSDMKIIDELY